jgi:ADP-dependent NAD(P)H-hydrate dehydratase / NAD(P)H-hydrate epimerase
MKILTAEQMASIDRRAVEDYGIPSIVLMENAAISVADAITATFPEARSAAIFCGSGNNGGDGFALARHLARRSLLVSVILLGSEESFTPDAKTNHDICVAMGLRIDRAESEDDLEEAVARGASADVVVDAIFGTGLSRAVEGWRGSLIESLNALSKPIVAIDLPSGLSGSSRHLDGPAVQADLTVTFVQPKIPHVFAPASDCCGSVVVADISVPDEAIEEEGCALDLITPDEVVDCFAPRDPDTHKGTWGHLVIVGGSEGRTGAAIMAARAAVRGGAGLVTVATDRQSAAVIDTVSIESMTRSFEMTRGAVAEILELLEEKDAALVGPGLPDDEVSYEMVRQLVAEAPVPLVIDASGLNAFAGRIADILSKQIRVITPHPGELARLLGRSTAEINDDRISSAREAAAISRAIVVLKGHQTLVADPDGRVSVNPTGNPGMGSGGMGDVLAGLVGALVARSDAVFEAVRAAVYLHGFAADMLRDEQSDTGLRAMELAEALPRAVARLRESR